MPFHRLETLVPDGSEKTTFQPLIAAPVVLVIVY